MLLGGEENGENGNIKKGRMGLKKKKKETHLSTRVEEYMDETWPRIVGFNVVKPG